MDDILYIFCFMQDRIQYEACEIVIGVMTFPLQYPRRKFS